MSTQSIISTLRYTSTVYDDDLVARVYYKLLLISLFQAFRLWSAEFRWWEVSKIVRRENKERLGLLCFFSLSIFRPCFTI